MTELSHKFHFTLCAAGPAYLAKWLEARALCTPEPGCCSRRNWPPAHICCLLEWRAPLQASNCVGMCTELAPASLFCLVGDQCAVGLPAEQAESQRAQHTAGTCTKPRLVSRARSKACPDKALASLVHFSRLMLQQVLGPAAGVPAVPAVPPVRCSHQQQRARIPPCSLLIDCAQISTASTYWILVLSRGLTSEAGRCKEVALTMQLHHACMSQEEGQVCML